MAAAVILLRAPSQDSPDRYEDCFRSSSYHVSSVPVLETVLTNLEQLKRIIRERPSSQAYNGVIITSARACEAWKTAVNDLLSTNSSSTSLPERVDWSSVPFYVVGKATATALSEIGAAYGHSRFAPRDIRGGSESGTSERLAHFITEDFAKHGTDGAKPTLLYLTGDKNRDTLPNLLGAAGFELEALKVYETQGSSSFAGDLEHAVLATSAGLDRWWIIFFAPSAAEFVASMLPKFFDLPPSDSKGELKSTGGSRVAAIGPTTATFLRDTLHLRVDVVPPKPTPDDLVDAIIQYDTTNPPPAVLVNCG